MLILLLLLYMIQGIPYGFQSRFLPLYLRERGLSLSVLGLLKLLYLPWIAKGLWAPLVDNQKGRRWWLCLSLMGLTFTCLYLSALGGTENLLALSLGLFFLNLCAATQDIAVDAVAIATLSKTQLAAGNVAQVVGYKLGAVIGGGLLMAVSQFLSWTHLFFLLATIYIIAFMLAQRSIQLRNCDEKEFLAKEEENKSSSIVDQQNCNNGIFISYRKLMSSMLQVRGTSFVAWFVLIYKLGEQGSMNMLPLFLLDQHTGGLSQVGWWTGVVGQIASVLGSTLGGVALRRMTSAGALPVLRNLCAIRLLFQVALCYVVISWPITTTDIHGFVNNWYFFYLAVALMNLLLLISGAITTATFTLMMDCSQGAPIRFQATHYTTLATLEVLGKLVFGTIAGSLTDMCGYTAANIFFLILTAFVPCYMTCFYHKLHFNKCL